ncbi:alpha/beta fold hydrolase [Adhaeribacter radiodurans]|uniref:Alpha/beta fold hydrolase n=1 Tax=Adhaeribacter radiodurans TaxID=2745197 RepID=A0A7L7LCK1_9BACT|nr:alpha/beta fold hydrolase [Adhaeribacter radiodurans]QMU30570.1 alpha/beta fold hydrolase [Adhaeribacter radiodurans]
MKKVFIFSAFLLSLFGQAQTPLQPLAATKQQPTISFQKVKFKNYAGDSILYELASIKVPENRLALPTDTIQIKILRLKAKSPTPLTPIIFLAGGPGQSGINYIKEDYFQKLIFPLQQQHDIILLDQRGSGSSRPSLLYKTPIIDSKDIFVSPQRMIEFADRIAQVGADTLKRRSIDIRGYTTLQNADDINDLSKALGYSKINLLAISYGTHLALTVAKKYPNILDKMVLIGTSGFNHMHHLPSTYDKQLQQIAALAAQDPAVKNEVPDMIAFLKRVLTKLEKDPVRLQIKEAKTNQLWEVRVGKFGLQMILRLDAGDSYGFIYFPALLYGIEKGDYEQLQEYIQKRFNQFTSGYGSGIGVMRLASGATKARYNQIIQEGKTALLGNAMNTPDLFGQNFWGKIDLGDDFRAPFTSNTRTLFVSGTMDSNSPAANVEEIKKGFTQATHVLVEYAGHEDMLPNENVQQVIKSFYQGASITRTFIPAPKPEFEPVTKR